MLPNGLRRSCALSELHYSVIRRLSLVGYSLSVSTTCGAHALIRERCSTRRVKTPLLWCCVITPMLRINRSGVFTRVGSCLATPMEVNVSRLFSLHPYPQ